SGSWRPVRPRCRARRRRRSATGSCSATSRGGRPSRTHWRRPWHAPAGSPSGRSAGSAGTPGSAGSSTTGTRRRPPPASTPSGPNAWRLGRARPLPWPARPRDAAGHRDPWTLVRRLTKHHGLGNDFLVALEAHNPGIVPDPDFARRVCDRRRGVGADGLILGLGPARDEDDVCMVLLNSDGSEAEI